MIKKDDEKQIRNEKIMEFDDISDPKEKENHILELAKNLTEDQKNFEFQEGYYTPQTIILENKDTKPIRTLQFLDIDPNSFDEEEQFKQL